LKLLGVVLDKTDFSLFRRLFPGVSRYLEELKSDSCNSQQKLGVKLQNFDLFWKSFDEMEILICRLRPYCSIEDVDGNTV
jgi:hypothetical protein